MTVPTPIIATQKKSVQFGVYRDGDNNLDEAQAAVIDQARAVSASNPHIAFSVEDTTHRDDELAPDGPLRTEEYQLINGHERDVHVDHPQDMADRSTLAQFVARTLDQAETNHAQATWLDLVDHGGGDGGAFQTNMSGGNVMSEDDIAGAIADGIHAHATAHPEDASRHVDGVIANACLMATLGMQSALSHVGVQFLAASPETMIAPGAPSSIAEDIAQHPGDPQAMAKAMVHRVMSTRYGIESERFGPAAAFDVFDLNPQKIHDMETAVKQLNQTIIETAKHSTAKAEIKADGRGIEGMTRSQAHNLPWHADRPAEAVYQSLASDTDLPENLRSAAQQALHAVSATVIAHGEAAHFEPFGDESYRDAVGPTVHFPTSRGQIDPWAPVISETHTAFADKVGERDVARALA